MNHLESWIHTPVAKALGWSLIHFLWQGMLIAFLLWMLLILCRPREARLRYALGCLALFAMAASFGLTFELLLPGGHAAIAVPARLALPVVPPGAAPALDVRPLDLKLALPWLVPLWMAGVLLLYLRSLASWIAVERLRRTGVCAATGDWQERLRRLRGRLNLDRSVALLESCLIDVPVVMGFLRPVILMPMGLLAGLSTDQVEAILLHELAHIRRWDYVVNLFQNLIEGLLFYHPAVWWVSGQVRTERENCCDDMVVKLKGDARGYAAALATLEQNRWSAREPALAASGGSLMKRIHRLLQQPEGPRASAAPILAAGLLLVSLGVAVAGWQNISTAAPKPVANAVPLTQREPAEAPAIVTPLPKKAPVSLVAQAVPPTSDQSAPVNGIETPYLRWMHEDVAYIISDEERIAFKHLQSDPDREHFIEQFWMRRDPTPGTTVNEFQEEHYRRIAYANDHFADKIDGWKTDRGRVYITYGPPDEIVSHPKGGGATSTFPFEEWRYRYIQDVGNDIVVEFVDANMSGEYRMTSDPSAKDALLSKPGPKYFVVGEVGRPGAFPLVTPTTVMEALVLAGGFRDFANRSEITIQRGAKTYIFNFKEVVTGQNRAQNIPLEPGDQIIVK